MDGESSSCKAHASNPCVLACFLSCTSVNHWRPVPCRKVSLMPATRLSCCRACALDARLTKQMRHTASSLPDIEHERAPSKEAASALAGSAGAFKLGALAMDGKVGEPMLLVLVLSVASAVSGAVSNSGVCSSTPSSPSCASTCGCFGLRGAIAAQRVCEHADVSTPFVAHHLARAHKRCGHTHLRVVRCCAVVLAVRLRQVLDGVSCFWVWDNDFRHLRYRMILVLVLPWPQQETCCTLQQATLQAYMFLKADVVCTATFGHTQNVNTRYTTWRTGPTT